jgi:hypothetical protein
MTLVIIGSCSGKDHFPWVTKWNLKLKNSTKEVGMGRVKFLLILVLSITWMAVSPTSTFAAYSSHQDDQDVNNFLSVYPFARSTKLDDCSLCHPGGSIKTGSKTTTYGSCDYCHVLCNLQTACTTIPLNGYGMDYRGRGRSQQAILNIEKENSDGDSFNNIQEIQALRFPGDAADYPGLVAAPAMVMNLERILQLSDHSEFLLNNASKSDDWYARYRGAKIKDLLRYVGIRPEATQITVFAPDGFSKSFPIDAPDPQSPPNIQYDVMGPYPYGYYYGGLDFVEYAFDPGYWHDDGQRIPDRLYMLLGYLRDGDPLDKGRLAPDPKNPGRLVLEGEGPYRLIVPQKISGGPDRPSTAPPVKDGWDYDSNKDHNAGSSVRSVTAIRVEPLPAGTTDFNWIEGGWNLVDKGRVVIYGAINPRTYWVWGKVTNQKGKPVDDVQISFGLVSLGQVGEASSGHWGRFWKDLPVGEYVTVPSKEGYVFEPESISFQLSSEGYRMEFKALKALSLP